MTNNIVSNTRTKMISHAIINKVILIVKLLNQIAQTIRCMAATLILIEFYAKIYLPKVIRLFNVITERRDKFVRI